MRSAVAATLALLFVATSCATPGDGGAGGLRAADYVDARVGARFTYRVTPGPEAPQTVTITHRDDRGFYVDDAGGRIAPRSDGVFDGSRFLIKDPVVDGSTWTAVAPGPRPGMPGITETYTVRAVRAAATVPAGTFDDCVVVEGTTPTRDPNDGRAAVLIMTWTWARGVGLVKLTQAVRYVGDDTTHQTASMELVARATAESAAAP